MIVKFIYKLLLPIIFIILTPLVPHALEIDVKPSEVFPGDVISVTVSSETRTAPEVLFLGKSFTMYEDTQGGFMALLPVDVETPPGEDKIIITTGGESREVLVRIMPYEFKTTELTLPEGKVTLSAEDQKRADEEYLLQKKLWKMGTKKAWSGKFVKPTDTPVSEEFGVRRIMNKKKTSVHRGIDLKGKSGTPVMAINAGKIVLEKDLFYGGNTLVIDHGMGLLSVYMHLSGFNLPEDTAVLKGDVIGFVGMTGRATGPHLHMSVKLQGVSINPLALMRLEL